MGKIAFVFPGQGSQTVGMAQKMAECDLDAKLIIEKADRRLESPLSRTMFSGPQEELTQTANAQPALLTSGIAILQGLRKAGIEPDYTAGHSLGEYTALVAAGAIPFEDAVYAVRKRGEYMEAAVPNGAGTMAAVLGLGREELQAITTEITQSGHPVQLANLNCPGQIVISGTKEGVEQAGAKAKEAGAKRVLPLQVSGPFHSSLMKPAADRFAHILGSIDIRQAKVPVIANVTAQPVTSPSEIKELLIEQLYSPVLWEDTVRELLALGVDTFIEIGPGKVLSGLIKKVDRNANIFAVQDPDSLEAALAELKGEEA